MLLLLLGLGEKEGDFRGGKEKKTSSSILMPSSALFVSHVRWILSGFFFVVVVISSDRLRKIKKRGETDIETYQAAHILGCIMSRSG